MTGGEKTTGRRWSEQLRLKRIPQAALVYVGAAWLGIEIAGFLVAEYAFSRKILNTVVLLAILGFPAFMVIAWYHGEPGAQRVRRGERWLLLTLGTLAAVGTFRIATAQNDPAEADADGVAPSAEAEAQGAPVTEPADAGSVIAVATAEDLGPRSLAVLPFKNNVPDTALQWLGPGLADLMTTNLAQLPGLTVVGRQSLYDMLTEQGRSEEDEIPESLALTVARGTGARLLLWGSVTGTAEDMRIDLQLIDLATGRIAQAESARGNDVFTLIDTLSVWASGQLVEQRPVGRFLRTSDLGTTDWEALAAFHRGNALAREGKLDEAEEHFQLAISLDSAFALPMLASRDWVAENDRRSWAGDPWYGDLVQGNEGILWPPFRSVTAEPGDSPDTGTRLDYEERRRIRNIQIYNRLPEEARLAWGALTGDEIQDLVDSLLVTQRSALEHLAGRRGPPEGS